MNIAEKYVEQASKFEDELTAIVYNMPGWYLDLVDTDRQCRYRIRHIKNVNHIHELYACSESGRITIYPSAWPMFTDTEGVIRVKRPKDVYCHGNACHSPSTSFAWGRDPMRVANQILKKVVDEYKQVYVLCLEAAEESMHYTNKNNEARKLLAAACRSEVNSYSLYVATFYAKDMPGALLRVDFRSMHSVKLEVDAEEAAAVVNYLRLRRAKIANRTTK